MKSGPWLVICGVKPSEWMYHLRQGKQLVGRARDCDVRLQHGRVSRRHAEIVYNEKKLTIRDLGSSNGTFVSDNRIGLSIFTAGDTVRIGSVTLDVLATLEGIRRFGDDEETDPAPDAQADLLEAVIDLLSPTDAAVLRLLLKCLTEKQVAAEVGMTENTVRWRVKRIYRALGVPSRAQLFSLFRYTNRVSSSRR